MRWHTTVKVKASVPLSLVMVLVIELMPWNFLNSVSGDLALSDGQWELTNIKGTVGDSDPRLTVFRSRLNQ